MLENATVEKKTKYSLTRQELEEMILREAGIEKSTGVSVSFEYSIFGGYDGGYDGYSSHEENWKPYVFGGLSVTVIERTTATVLPKKAL